MTYKAIVFRPESDNRMRQSRHVFYRNVTQTPVTRGSKEAPVVELKNTVLVDGANFVDAAIWAQVEAHLPNVKIVKAMQDNRSLLIATPDAETIVNCSADFTDIGIVKAIIGGCKAHNLKWLERSMARDQRPEVFKLLGEKIDDLKEEEVDRRNRSKSLSEALI